MEFSIKLYTIVRMVHCIYMKVIIKKNIVFLSLKTDFVLGNSADPDEMPNYVSFHLSLRSLPKVPI